MRLEDRLERLPEGFSGGTDPDASLAHVVRAGRRKRAVRRGGIVVAVATGVAAVAVSLPATGPAAPRVDPLGPGPSSVADPPSGSPTPEPSASAGVMSVSPLPSASPTPTAGGTSSDEPVVDDFPSPAPRLELAVRTDRGSYATGETVTITIEACNTAAEPHEEYFFEEGSRYTLRVLTEDRRAIAYTSPDGGDQAATEVWAPGECRTWTDVWDQSEGAFDEPGGQQAEPGDHTVLLDWHGVPPPPPGTDPRLYDPAGRGGAESRPFTIEEPAGPIEVPSTP